MSPGKLDDIVRFSQFGNGVKWDIDLSRFSGNRACYKNLSHLVELTVLIDEIGKAINVLEGVRDDEDNKHRAMNGQRLSHIVIKQLGRNSSSDKVFDAIINHQPFANLNFPYEKMQTDIGDLQLTRKGITRLARHTLAMEKLYASMICVFDELAEKQKTKLLNKEQRRAAEKARLEDEAAKAFTEAYERAKRGSASSSRKSSAASRKSLPPSYEEAVRGGSSTKRDPEKQ